MASVVCFQAAKAVESESWHGRVFKICWVVILGLFETVEIPSFFSSISFSPTRGKIPRSGVVAKRKEVRAGHF